MGLGFIEYRDPLVGIIALFSLILLAWMGNSVFAKYKTSTKTKRLEKFIENFSLNLSGEDEIAQIIKESPNAAKVLFVVGEGYMLAGELEKAVRFFTLILKNVPTRGKELHIRTLVALAKCYLRLGFIQRTKSSLIEALRLRPRNKEALFLLLTVYAKTAEYDDALGVSQALLEMSEECAPYARFFESFRAFKKGRSAAEAYISCGEPYFLREQAKELALIGNTSGLIALSCDNDAALLYDILWQTTPNKAQLEQIQKNERLSELFAAKGVVEKVGEFADFELEKAYALGKVRPNASVVVFEFRCSSCGYEDFDYFPICKKCAKLSSCVLLPKVIKKETRDFDMSSFS
jgi:lipopolysaccharide assembly protein B